MTGCTHAWIEDDHRDFEVCMLCRIRRRSLAPRFDPGDVMYASPPCRPTAKAPRPAPAPPKPLNLADLEDGVRLVSHTGESTYDEDPALPFRVHVVLSPPEFMVVTWTLLHGGMEEAVARGETLAAIEAWLVKHGLGDHPRLRRITITGPDNLTIERDRAGRSPR